MSTAALNEAHHHDATGAKIGMWLFLFTEFLLFGGLFLVYAEYRTIYATDFHYAAMSLNLLIGAFNTLILLTSSLTMALSIAALERGLRRLSCVLLVVTIGFGLFFLVNKYFEWSEKFHHGLYPGSEVLAGRTPGEGVFYGLYFAMTGLHALHVVIGLVVLGAMLGIVARKPRLKARVEGLAPARLVLQDASGQTIWSREVAEPPEAVELALVYPEHDEVREPQVTKLENSGLYWHLVDVIWIFLFPLFYLIS
jgi:cytochrome c oxidase subunit 3